METASERLILASASPRRREMLSALGVDFEAVAADVEEVTEGLDPEGLVMENARRKAEAGLALAGAGEGDVALGVDTEVFLEDRPLGKAGNEGEARERLLALSGRTHEVLSGVALARLDAEWSEPPAMRERATTRRETPTDDRLRTAVARSLVTFKDLSDTDVSRYLASGEWRDRAGAYAIQGLGSTLIARLDGDFSNVVGLPLQLLLELAPGLFTPISSESERTWENSRPLH